MMNLYPWKTVRVTNIAECIFDFHLFSLGRSEKIISHCNSGFSVKNNIGIFKPCISPSFIANPLSSAHSLFDAAKYDIAESKFGLNCSTDARVGLKSTFVNPYAYRILHDFVLPQHNHS